MHLSQHFTLEELAGSDLAARNGIDNTPPPEAIENLKRLCEKLEVVRKVINKPILISSGYRCPELNKLVGGSPTSAHLYGLAVDIKSPTYGSALKLCELISCSNVEYDQIIHEYKSWCHFAISGSGDPRKMLLTKNHGSDYKTGLA
jgi:zinc D-Ala-D-Ala carboxypeptidase